MNRSLQRRRQLLAGLVIVSVVALLVALVTSSGLMWGLHLIADVLLAVYVGVLLHIRNTAANTEMTSRALGD